MIYLRVLLENPSDRRTLLPRTFKHPVNVNINDSLRGGTF